MVTGMALHSKNGSSRATHPMPSLQKFLFNASTLVWTEEAFASKVRHAHGSHLLRETR